MVYCALLLFQKANFRSISLQEFVILYTTTCSASASLGVRSRSNQQNTTTWTLWLYVNFLCENSTAPVDPPLVDETSVALLHWTTLTLLNIELPLEKGLWSTITHRLKGLVCFESSFNISSIAFFLSQLHSRGE